MSRYPTEPVLVLIMFPKANATSKGHASTKSLLDMARRGLEKSVATKKIGKLRVIDHLDITLNMIASFSCSPRVWSSAIVGANIELREVCGITINPLNLIAAIYKPICPLEIAKKASNN